METRPRLTDHRVEVTALTDYTPWYRRVTFAANGLFDQWSPAPGAYLLLNLDDGTHPVQRAYSLGDPTPDRFHLEFVLHERPGPGARWASAAQPGDTITVTEPVYHLTIPAAAHAVLIADTSALAALAAIQPACPMPTTVLLVDAHPDRAALPYPPHATWVDELTDADLRRLTAGLDPATCFLWAAGERRLAKQVREFARTAFPVPRAAQHVQTYWIAPDPAAA